MEEYQIWTMFNQARQADAIVGIMTILMIWLALRVANMYPDLVDNVIAQNPFFKVNESLQPSSLKQIFLQIAGHIMPYNQLPFPKSTVDTYNEEFYQKFIDDPLCWCGSIRYGTILGLLKLSEWNQANISKLQVPTLIQLGTDDKWLSASYTKSIMQYHKRVEIKEYDNAGHDYFEKEEFSNKFFNDALSWFLEEKN